MIPAYTLTLIYSNGCPAGPNHTKIKTEDGDWRMIDHAANGSVRYYRKAADAANEGRDHMNHATAPASGFEVRRTTLPQGAVFSNYFSA